MLPLIGLLSAALAQQPAPHASASPDSARFITSDIRLFWDAVDRAPPESLEVYLQRDYLDKASVGVRDFMRGRIVSAHELAVMVQSRRARYDASRAASVAIADAEPAMRAAFHRLKAIYPDAVFPDVYFVVGRLNSGGTASNNGLLIGAEMWRSTEGLPAIVSHEVIHFQQHALAITLLAHAFMEGSADFLGEMISGAQINNAARVYGLAHEHELWEEFKLRLNDTRYTGWMYEDPPGERPADLGYFIGYRIAEAYYARAADKSQAVRDIIAVPNIMTFLEASGYNP